MAFIAGAAGGVIIWRIAHDNHSDYSDWREHNNHRQYGDSSIRQAISDKEYAINRKASNLETLRRQLNENFNSRVNELKREKNYSGLDSSPPDIIDSVKADMRRELDKEISQERQELETIDKMIARINELELQAKR